MNLDKLVCGITCGDVGHGDTGWSTSIWHLGIGHLTTRNITLPCVRHFFLFYAKEQTLETKKKGEGEGEIGKKRESVTT